MGNIFKNIDQNNDGLLSVDEFKNAIEKKILGNSNQIQFISDTFSKIDTDKDGFIDYTEFIAASIDQNIYLKEDKIFRIFQIMDTNGDG